MKEIVKIGSVDPELNWIFGLQKSQKKELNASKT